MSAVAPVAPVAPVAELAEVRCERAAARPGYGSLDIIARRSGPRTVLERVRYDGISRCSRAFAEHAAARVVLSQLGPGVMRGDETRLMGRLRAASHLIVTSQTATRLLGGATRARATADWTLDDDATLEIVGEPLIAGADANYESTTTIELGERAQAIVSEVVYAQRGARVLVRTCIRRAGRDLVYDAVDIAATPAPAAVGTLLLPGLAPAAVDPLVAALDAVADTRTDVRTGVGALRCGVFARLVGTDLWMIRALLGTLRDTARALIA